MTVASLSTIAQLLCQTKHHLNFARLVSDLDSVLERMRDLPRNVIWDCDDVAIFDLPGTRILLAWTDDPGQGLDGILTLSVGPSPLPSPPGPVPDYNALCARLVERVQDRMSAAAILWHQIDCIMSAEWVDLLIDSLPDLPDFLTPGPDLQMQAGQTPVSALSAILPGAPTDRPAANDRPDLPRHHDPELQRLRAALYEDVEEVMPSVPMRLAVHAMNATLIMVWLPLGAAAMTHGLLKGEDMRLASRLMVLTGTIGALAQTPWGHQVVAMAQL